MFEDSTCRQFVTCTPSLRKQPLLCMQVILALNDMVVKILVLSLSLSLSLSMTEWSPNLQLEKWRRKTFLVLVHQ
jgi:hypothetical protein